MSRKIAKISIEVEFSQKLAQTVKEDGTMTLQGVINRLVNEYKKSIKDADHFKRPLKVLDKGVKIEVKGEVY